MHDRTILDALEAWPSNPFSGEVWRVAQRGRSAAQGSIAPGRWSPGDGVEVLYASLERDGALAEIGFRLSLEPVWPSRLQHTLHRLIAAASRTLTFADVASLAPLGVAPARYESFDYAATQAIAAAAYFLEFDGLIVPSARHRCRNLVLFTDRLPADALSLAVSEPVDWSAWRAQRRR